jgi:hypothetical protein
VGLGGDGKTYVVAAGGVVLRSADNATFSRSITGFQTAAGIGNPAIIGLSVIDNKLYAGAVQGSGTTGGAILQSTDGISFTSVSNGHADIWDITKVDGTYYAAGNGGTILTSANGTTWERANHRLCHQYPEYLVIGRKADRDGQRWHDPGVELVQQHLGVEGWRPGFLASSLISPMAMAPMLPWAATVPGKAMC